MRWRKGLLYMALVTGLGVAIPPGGMAGAAFEQEGWLCVPTQTLKPPFWVTDADPTMEGREYENFKDIDSEASNVTRNNIAYIPRRSIVRLLTDEYDVLKKNDGSDYFPVEVLSTPDEKIDEAQNLDKHYTRSSGLRTGRPRVKRGDKGYIYAGSVIEETNTVVDFIRSGGNTSQITEPLTVRENLSLIAPNTEATQTPDKPEILFTVTKETSFLGIAENLRNRPLRLATVIDEETGNQLYRVSKCTNPKNPKEFFLNYQFEVLSDDLSTVEMTIPFNPDECIDDLSYLLPVDRHMFTDLKEIIDLHNESAKKTLSLGDLVYSSQRGMVQLPTDLVSIPYCSNGNCSDSEGGYDQYILMANGPYDSLHYPDARCIENSPPNFKKPNSVVKSCQKENASDQYLTPHAAKQFMKFLKNYKEGCPNCPPVEWGDGFWPESARHRGHDDGNCVDIRPLKKRDSSGSYFIGATKIGNSNYDRQATKNLVKRLFESGASKVIYGEKLDIDDVMIVTETVETEGGETKKIVTHRDHIHVCF